MKNCYRIRTTIDRRPVVFYVHRGWLTGEWPRKENADRQRRAAS